MSHTTGKCCDTLAPKLEGTSGTISGRANRWWVRWLNGSIASGVTMFLVGVVFYVLIPFVAPNIPQQYDELTNLYRRWPGWTSKYMIVHPFGFGILFTGGYLWLRCRASFDGGVRGGLMYGLGVCLVGSLPVYLLTFAATHVSPEVILVWILQNLVQYTFAGIVLGSVCDTVYINVSSTFPITASKFWQLLMQKDTFLFITQGMISFLETDSWPDKLFNEKTILSTRLRLFGWGPPSGHNVFVCRVDEQQMEIETQESGGLVWLWDHQMRVEVSPNTKCRYTDRVQLNAGLATPLVWLFASVFYRYRHWRWGKKILEV